MPSNIPEGKICDSEDYPLNLERTTSVNSILHHNANDINEVLNVC